MFMLTYKTITLIFCNCMSLKLIICFSILSYVTRASILSTKSAMVNPCKSPAKLVELENVFFVFLHIRQIQVMNYTLIVKNITFGITK